MPVPVDFFVQSDDIVPVPIAGAVVVVLDPSSSLALMGQATTDVDGRASFVLPGSDGQGRVYEVRLFKMGVIFSNPKRVAVLEPDTSPNVFDIFGTLTVLPAATDPRICRCTGRFLNFANMPIAGATVRITSKSESGLEVPKVVDGNMVASEAMALTTNVNGYVTADLHRGGEYYVMFSGSNDRPWNFRVPDRASANLIDLIHPYPVLLDWDPTAAPNAAISVGVDEIIEVPFSITFSDYEVLTEGLSKWVSLASSDVTIALVAVEGGRAYIRGVAPGSAQVTASCQSGLSPVRFPVPSIVALPLDVTVLAAP